MRLRRLRTAAMMISIAVAAAGFLVFERLLGQEKLHVEDRAVIGSWTEEKTGLDLGDDGRYVFYFLDSAGRLSAAECGRWATYDGILHLRADWTRTHATPSLLSSPSLRQGEYRLGKDSLAVDLKGGSGSETLLMSRGVPAREALSHALDEEERRRCGLGATR